LNFAFWVLNGDVFLSFIRFLAISKINRRQTVSENLISLLSLWVS